jgi:hypothetical protein
MLAKKKLAHQRYPGEQYASLHTVEFLKNKNE